MLLEQNSAKESNFQKNLEFSGWNSRENLKSISTICLLKKQG